MVTSVMTSSAVAWNVKALVTVAVLPGAMVNAAGSVVLAAVRVVVALTGVAGLPVGTTPKE